MPHVIKIQRTGQPCPGEQKAAKQPDGGGSFAAKAVKYGAAYVRWKASGSPIRPEAEQRYIFEQICRTCPHFRPRKKGGGKCNLCGCSLNLHTDKLKWSSECCPDNPPRWQAGPLNIGQESTTVQDAPASETRRQRRIRERREARAMRAANRAKAREDRKKGRESRRKRKEEERMALGGIMPEVLHAQKVDDPLVLCDRFSLPIGHALRGMWAGCAAFYVCGGPSLKQIDLSFLRERGIASMGLNNVAGYAPVRAMTFSDPASKFHHGIFFDPAIIKFVPKPKLSERVRAKVDGKFQWTAYEVRSCPSVFGFERDGIWYPDQFLTREKATWGVSHKHKEMQSKQKILFSFFLGIRLLHYLGVRRIYLLGVDFGMDAKHHYAFDQYRHDGAIAGNNNSYRVATGMLAELRPYLDKAGLEIYQTNRQSNLRVFDFVDLPTAIADCRGLVPQEPYDLQAWYEKPKHGAEPAIQDTDDRGEE